MSHRHDQPLSPFLLSKMLPQMPIIIFPKARPLAELWRWIKEKVTFSDEARSWPERSRGKGKSEPHSQIGFPFNGWVGYFGAYQGKWNDYMGQKSGITYIEILKVIVFGENFSDFISFCLPIYF